MLAEAELQLVQAKFAREHYEYEVQKLEARISRLKGGGKRWTLPAQD